MFNIKTAGQSKPGDKKKKPSKKKSPDAPVPN